MTMAWQLTCAGTRLDSLLSDLSKPIASGSYTLYETQTSVFKDAANYILDIATREHISSPPMARIILPPRTGKTVVAAHLIAATRLSCTFFVPTKALIEQTARELRKILPQEISVGVFYGDGKNLAFDGVNVTTYQICQTMISSKKALPEEITRSMLIFADEGHRAMTSARHGMLLNSFNTLAIRIALTATPDYDEDRVLSHYFPDFIHEVTVPEAVELDMLAPLRVWVVEVDEDASHVNMTSEDLDQSELGKIMSQAPFLEAALHLRYSEQNAATPAVIFCSSKAQARAVLDYFVRKRPDNAPEPKLLLGTTGAQERRDILSGYDVGQFDTLISVGVLIEGWNSPQCKLEIDLAPSISFVRAKQKYFRVLTRHDNSEAKIYVIIPSKLRRSPVLPMELFSLSSDFYESGSLIASQKIRNHLLAKGSVSKNDKLLDVSSIEKVHLVSRVVLASRLEKPKLNPASLEEVREVVLSNEAVFVKEQFCGLLAFRWMRFSHPLFTGRGEQLLRYLGVPCSREGYVDYLARLFPDAATTMWLGYQCDKISDVTNIGADEEYRLVKSSLLGRVPGWGGRELAQDVAEILWRTACGPSNLDQHYDPEIHYEFRDTLTKVYDVIFTNLTERQRETVLDFFGLCGRKAKTFPEIATANKICRESIRLAFLRSLRRIRFLLRNKHVSF